MRRKPNEEQLAGMALLAALVTGVDPDFILREYRVALATDDAAGLFDENCDAPSIGLPIANANISRERQRLLNEKHKNILN